MRQIVLDTETTGLEPSMGHRIIEIGCVEVINRQLTGRHYHQYINPEMEIDAGAFEVHGISNDFLADKPLFAAIADDFMNFVRGAELVIHNAPFDIGFLDTEMRRLEAGFEGVAKQCGVLDTLVMARNMYPGGRNNLDRLCSRLGVDNSQRDLHGALLDAEILADVYLLMTGGQTDLELGGHQGVGGAGGVIGSDIIRLQENRQKTPILLATEEELARHKQWLSAHRGEPEQALWPEES
ncbi:MAG: DNA polymerase III subunit epsilon [Pseudomonadales bacterium]